MASRTIIIGEGEGGAGPPCPLDPPLDLTALDVCFSSPAQGCSKQKNIGQAIQTSRNGIIVCILV